MLKIVIASPEISSWSMRAWLVLKATGLDFSEEIIKLGQDDTRKRLKICSPTGKIPILKHNHLAVWDSLAISLYLHEICPEANLLPGNLKSRFKALSLISEIHSSFLALRQECPMDLLQQHHKTKNLSENAQSDINRVIEIIEQKEGDYIFDSYSMVDCFLAPIMTRFRTYGILVPDDVKSYEEQILNHPHMIEWFKKSDS